MLVDIMLNIILVMFPLLIYFVFCCCNILNDKGYSKAFLIITLLTSLYLGINYNMISNNNILLFCNIPIVIAYIRKERELAIILSMIMIIASYNIYDANIIIASVKYVLYFVCYNLLIKKKNFKNDFFCIVAIIQGFFMSFEYFFKNSDSVTKIIEIIVIVFIMYIITFIAIYLFNLADKMTNIYQDMQAYTNQEKIKNSLFKLTHEIKNPIAVCKGYLDMMDLNDSKKVSKYISIIKTEIDRSLNIMNDFMEYSKIKLEINELDLSMLLEDIYDALNVLLSSKNISFSYINNYEEIYLNGDYDRLKQVFINIIKNGVESIDDKGKIECNVSIIKNNVIIKISDNGRGMSKEELEHIKEIFYTTKKNGTGIGVSLSTEIVNLHGGSLEYDSIENVGTTCTITLPILKVW